MSKTSGGLQLTAVAPAPFSGIAPTRDADAAAADVAFPAGFVWGAASSAYQIEGAVAADGRGESVWDRFCAVPGNVADGTTGIDACRHFERWADDVALLARLGIGAYRFSIAWPRVVPDGTGPRNPAGLDFYDRLVDGLLAAGVEPYPTLFHWDLPQRLEDVGGWPARATAEAFADYAEVVVDRLGDRVTNWTTINEPFCAAFHGYVTGLKAPGRRSFADGCAAGHHLLLAHGLAVPRIRERVAGARVSIALNFTPVHSATDDHADVAHAAPVDGLENRWYVEPIAGLGYPETTAAAMGWSGSEVRDGDLELIAAPIDELSINYYTRQIVSAVNPRAHVPRSRTDTGWEIYPEGLTALLHDLHARYRFPRYLVTENGAAMRDRPDADGFVDDQDRIAYLRDHLVAVHDARRLGVPVEGYFVWSLLDNFEWEEGLAKRFGIVRVDYDTFERIPKASARWYAEVARTGLVQREG
jgi:beta-glucosidase